MDGFVYYARNGHKIKIGFSKNPWARITELKTGCPELRLVATERGTKELEKQRHNQFSEYRFVGEWFCLSDDIRGHLNVLAGRSQPSKAFDRTAYQREYMRKRRNNLSGGVGAMRHARIDSADGEQSLSSCGSSAPPAQNSNRPKFDRVAYQREYMRRRRANARKP